MVGHIGKSRMKTTTLSNAAPDTPFDQLVEPSCSRYFVERTIQDGKAECGWDEFQAQKYPAWVHHTALTACTFWFIAKTKLKYALECQRDPRSCPATRSRSAPSFIDCHCPRTHESRSPFALVVNRSGQTSGRQTPGQSFSLDCQSP
jgi:hypothetical protein